MRAPTEYATLQAPVSDESRLTYGGDLTYDWNDDRQDGTWMYWQAVRQFGDDGEWTGVYTPGAWWSIDDGALGSLLAAPPSGIHPVFGPTSSYWWPLTDRLQDPAAVTTRLLDLPVALVRHGRTYGLGLTGGGQQLSWHLAYAAVRCGFLPWFGLELHQDRWETGVSLVGADVAAVVRDALIERYEREGTTPGRLERVRAWGRE